MKKHLRRMLLILSAVAFMGLLLSTGCQTTKGLGKDVENLGENIQGN